MDNFDGYSLKKLLDLQDEDTRMFATNVRINFTLNSLHLFKSPNRIKAHPIIEAQSQGYNFPDILEAHPIPNKNKTDNFKKF